MKKIISNRILQVTCLTIFVAVIGVLVYRSAGTVRADDNVNMKIYNERKKEVDTTLKELEEKISMLEEKTKTIATLQDDLLNANEKIKSLETQLATNEKNINTTTNRVNKIETREDYLYSEIYRTGANQQPIHNAVKHIINNLK